MRNKILQGDLKWDEYNDNKVYKFLSILKRQNQTNITYQYSQITKEEWISVVKKSKKKSLSSIFSKRNYSIYKCTIDNERFTNLLLQYYNTIIKLGYYPKR